MLYYINRPAGHPGFGGHSHEYADQQPELGLIRIFFYLNGFSSNDAALKVVAGSHLYRDGDIGKSVAPTGSDEELIRDLTEKGIRDICYHQNHCYAEDSGLFDLL